MYLESLAESIRSEVLRSADIPDDSEELFLIYALLCRSKGRTTTLEDVHDAWAIWMAARNPLHPALVEFAQLSHNQQQEDVPYLNGIHAASH